MGLRNESPNNHVLVTIEEAELNRGKTCGDMGGFSKLQTSKLAMKTFSSLTFLYWLCNSYPQQRGEINDTQARNGCKLGIIGLVFNSGHENQLVYSQSHVKWTCLTSISARQRKVHHPGWTPVLPEMETGHECLKCKCLCLCQHTRGRGSACYQSVRP